MEVLVTGGDTDLGRTIAEGFRDAGHRVVIAGARRADLEVAAKELEVDAIVFDNTDPASLEEARGQFPHHLDTIVNVPAPREEAGDPRTYSLSDLATAWRSALDATVLSAVLTVQIVGDHLRSGGSIVNVVPDHPAEGSADAAIKAAVSDWTAGPVDPLRHPGHHRERGGIGPQRGAGLCGPVADAAVGGRGDRPVGGVPDHSRRPSHHRPDVARQPRGTRQLRLEYSSVRR